MKKNAFKVLPSKSRKNYLVEAIVVGTISLLLGFLILGAVKLVKKSLKALTK